MTFSENSNDSDYELRDELQKRDAFNNPQQEAYLNLIRTHSVLAAKFSRLFKEHGVSDPQYNALRILRGNGDPMHIHQIAERMVAKQTDISRLIVRLEESNWVKRNHCCEDRRVIWVELTRKGKSLLKRLDEPVRSLHESQFQKLSKKELGMLSKLLLKARQ